MGKEPISMSNSGINPDNQEFIKKLELLRDLEAEKPVEEMDVSLIKACVELILELRGENIHLSTEEVKEKVRKIPFVEETTSLNTPPQSVKSRSTKVKSHKILLIAAIISILIAIFAISSIAFEWNIFDELKNRFGTVADAPVNEEMEMGGITVGSNGKSTLYSDLEEALKNENIDILYPTKLPTNVTINKLLFYQENQNNKIALIFNNENLSYFVTLNQSLSDIQKSAANEMLTVNTIDCYIVEMDDLGMIQINFDYKGNSYSISYNNKQDLINIVENLKEIQ